MSSIVRLYIALIFLVPLHFAIAQDAELDALIHLEEDYDISDEEFSDKSEKEEKPKQKQKKIRNKKIERSSPRKSKIEFEDFSKASNSQEFSWERTPRGSDFFGASSGFDIEPGKLAGEVQLEGRAFEKVDQRSITADKSAAVFVRAEMPFESKSGIWGAKAKGYGRVDALDEGRNGFFPEDLWIAYNMDFFQATFGFQTFSWTQMDIFSPGELLNSVNFDSEVENLEKIGELALNVKMKLAFGFLEVSYMPLVLSPNFPGKKSRFNLLSAGDEMGVPIYVKKDGSIVERKQFNQFAGMFSRSIGDADVNLFFVDQMDRRTPEIVVQAASGESRPVFFPITSFGMNTVYAFHGTLFKFEAVRRLVTNPAQPTIFGDLRKQSHTVAALGAEREVDLFWTHTTLFFEYQKVFQVSEGSTLIDRQKISLFQNDLAFGLKMSFNDAQSREIRMLVDLDMDRQEQILGSISYKQRVGESWQVHGGYRYIHAPQADERIAIGLERFDKDNYGFIQLTRFF